MYLAFSCAVIQGFRQTRARKIRILWPACGFFVYFKIQMKSNASGSYDGYVAFSGAIPPKFSTINWHAGHANSNASGSCDGYVTFSCALNSTFLHLRASKIWILWQVCRFFGRNTNSSEIECIRILSPACRFFGCNKILMSLQKSDTPVTRYGSSVAFSCTSKSKWNRMHPDPVTSMPLSRVQYHPNFPTKKWRAGHANSNASGSCDGYVTCSCAVKWTFLHLRASKIRILYRGCRVFGCNTIRISQQKSWHAGHAIRIHFKIKLSKVRMEADLVTGVSLSRVHKK